jgi:hypothetical protein
LVRTKLLRMALLIGSADLHCLHNQASSHDLNRGERLLFGLRHPYSVINDKTTGVNSVPPQKLLKEDNDQFEQQFDLQETSSAGKKESCVSEEDQDVIYLFPLR